MRCLYLILALHLLNLLCDTSMHFWTNYKQRIRELASNQIGSHRSDCESLYTPFRSCPSLFECYLWSFPFVFVIFPPCPGVYWRQSARFSINNEHYASFIKFFEDSASQQKRRRCYEKDSWAECMWSYQLRSENKTSTEGLCGQGMATKEKPQFKVSRLLTSCPLTTRVRTTGKVQILGNRKSIIPRTPGYRKFWLSEFLLSLWRMFVIHKGYWSRFKGLQVHLFQKSLRYFA